MTNTYIHFNNIHFDARLASSRLQYEIEMDEPLRTLLHRLWLCSDEYGRLFRAMDRSRPVDRLYARIRRIVLMLDLTWSARDGDPVTDIQERIESLMTWHPTLKKGMRLLAPQSAPYLAALERLLSDIDGLDVGMANRLRDLPEHPRDWDYGPEFLAVFGEIKANIQASQRLIGIVSEKALNRLGLPGWDWIEIAGEGTFKFLDCRGELAIAGTPKNGKLHRFHTLWAIHHKALRPVTDAWRIAQLENNNLCLTVPPPREWLDICDLVSGRPDGLARCNVRRLTDELGRYLHALDAANYRAKETGAGQISSDQERIHLQAFWLRLKFAAVLQRCAQGKPVHPGSFWPLRHCKTGLRLRMVLYSDMLDQIGLEASLLGEIIELRLTTTLSTVTRRAICEPEHWLAGGYSLRRAAINEYLSHDFGFVRVGVHATRWRTRNRPLLLLKHIASDDFVQAVILFLFDYVDYRYRWTDGSVTRLRKLSDLLGQYAANQTAG
jgi:hypothetical protein